MAAQTETGSGAFVAPCLAAWASVVAVVPSDSGTGCPVVVAGPTPSAAASPGAVPWPAATPPPALEPPEPLVPPPEAAAPPPLSSLLPAGHRGDRERLALERHQRLGGDPDGSLGRRRGVGDASVPALQPHEVAACARGGGTARAGRDQALDRVCGRLRVRGAALEHAEAAV